MINGVSSSRSSVRKLARLHQRGIQTSVTKAEKESRGGAGQPFKNGPRNFGIRASPGGPE